MGDEVHLGRPMRLDRHAAAALLRRIGQERAGMAELRRLYAEEVRRSSLHALRDEAVLSLLADRIAAGDLVVSMLRLPEHPAPPEMNPGESAVSEAAAAVAQEEPRKAASITNPRWSAPRVEVGAEVEAAFTYSGFVDDKSATVKVFEVDKNGSLDPIGDPIDVTVETEDGDHTFKWKRSPEGAQADLEEDQGEGEEGPLEYRFTVEAKNAGHAGYSGPLWLTNTVTVELVDDEAEALAEERVIVLLDALGDESRTTSKDGAATFEKVLVGPIRIRLAEPRFSALAWSKPKVPVGEAVDAVFRYEDAMEGMKVTVAIHEFNTDGSTTEIERIELELPAAEGEAKASFTRTEDEAQEDMATDEREGDTGPIEYRYFVVADGGHASEASAPLHLTHDVTLKLEDAADGAPFPDGTELLLVGADGTEHSAALSGGEVKFEGVVCGPVTVKLSPKGDGGGGA